MTKEEALKRIAESYNEAKADFEENEDCYSDKSFIDGVYQGVTSACFYINQIDEQKWHTEKPTEEGWYVCRVDWSMKPFETLKYEDGDWWLDYDEPISDVIAWQKIEPYEESDQS